MPPSETKAEHRRYISGVDNLDLLRRTDGPGSTYNTRSKASLLERASSGRYVGARQCSVRVVNIATNGDGSALLTDEGGAL